MEDSRTSNSFQRLASTFDTIIEIPEADITAIPAFRPESFVTGNNRNIPVSTQELVYGNKAAEVRTSARYLDRNNELVSSSKYVHGPRKDKDLLKGWTPISCKGQVQKIKDWLKNQSMLSEDQKRSWPKERTTAQWKLPNPPQAKITLKRCQRRERNAQRTIRRESKRKRGSQSPSRKILTHRTTEFPRKRRQLWTMCSI
ncbi:hypothetical protein O181_063691 [Austropuccinia psidii MF-1]|uniref:Uncharacterized protein n=1 Tax=Austropuccinia psidii MF-1 TaxID=1389203 RepID=A0A9Q3HZM1_9BASI|nr:hypothetical protein [Austropuccinia psidii MF-1]